MSPWLAIHIYLALSVTAPLFKHTVKEESYLKCLEAK